MSLLANFQLYRQNYSYDDRFLKAKHWQLFLLTFVIPFLLQILFIIQIFFITQQVYLNGGAPDSVALAMGGSLFTIPCFMVLFVSIYLVWIWSVSIDFQKKVPANLIMKVKKFKMLFFFPLVYAVVFIVSVTHFPISMRLQPNAIFFSVFFSVHLFAMYCMFYSLYFMAKTIKTVELQRKVSFGDFAGEFFMIWFFPIGLWILQPKINKMAEE